jgi:4-hydroxybenzoate polyprenyltransferase
MIKRIVIFLKAIRVVESALMLGFPLIGTLFAMSDLSWGAFMKTLRFLLPTYGMVIYVYALNSWGGIDEDRRNKRLENHPVLTGEITPLQLTVVAICGLVISFFLYLLWLPECFAIAMAIACNWTLYSHPKIMAKSKPIYGSLIHFTGGILQFLLGWVVLKDLSFDGLAPAIYFAAVFTAGHMNHEVKDHDADKAGGIRTNAVVFGPRRMLHIAFAVFLLGALYLLAVSNADLVPWRLSLPFIAIAPLHAIAHFTMLPAPNKAYRVSYQQTYRSLYVAAGFVMFITQFVRLWDV